MGGISLADSADGADFCVCGKKNLNKWGYFVLTSAESARKLILSGESEGGCGSLAHDVGVA